MAQGDSVRASPMSMIDSDARTARAGAKRDSDAHLQIRIGFWNKYSVPTFSKVWPVTKSRD